MSAAAAKPDVKAGTDADGLPLEMAYNATTAADQLAASKPAAAAPPVKGLPAGGKASAEERESAVEELRALIHDRNAKNAVTVVTGAGVSALIAPRHIDVLLWDRFIDQLLQAGAAYSQHPPQAQIPKVDPKGDYGSELLRLGQAASDLMKGWDMIGLNYNNLVHRLFAAVRPEPQQDPMGQLGLAIAALKCPIATTNYDCLLEECTGRLPVNLLAQHDQKMMKGQYAPNGVVYHLHGMYYSSEGFVLGKQEYEAQTKAFMEAAKDLVAPSARLERYPDVPQPKRSLLFLGVLAGLTDPHFLPFLTWCQEKHPDLKHYWVVGGNEEPNCRTALAEKKLTNIVVIRCGEGKSRDHLIPFVWELNRLPNRDRNIEFTSTIYRDKKKTITGATITVPAAGTVTAAASQAETLDKIASDPQVDVQINKFLYDGIPQCWSTPLSLVASGAVPGQASAVDSKAAPSASAGAAGAGLAAGAPKVSGDGKAAAAATAKLALDGKAPASAAGK